jgi:hypothetical protein
MRTLYHLQLAEREQQLTSANHCQVRNINSQNTEFAEGSSMEDGDGGTRLSPLYLLLYSPLTLLSYINQPKCSLVIILNIHVNRRRAGKFKGKIVDRQKRLETSSINLYKNRKVVRIK